MSTIRPEFATSLITKSINDIFYRRSNFFYFLGKVDDWSGQVPTDISNTVYDDNSIRDNILYVKRVSSNDVSLVVPKYVWSSKVWDQWDHTVDMSTKSFYCINSEFNVYKCLSNNNGGISTIEPTGMTYDVIKTSDGYIWKYMYNIPAFKRSKFIDQNYIPVQKALTDTFYSKGSISQVIVNSGGSGYASTLSTTISVTGGTTGQSAVLVPGLNSNGEIIKVSIINGGTDYTTAPTLTVNQIGTTGTGKYGNATAKLKAVIYNGSVVNVSIEDPGINYPSNTTTVITVSGDGTNASLIPIVYYGSIVDVVIDNPGNNYTTTSLSITGTGIGASISAILAQPDFISDQAYVEQTTVKGAIYATSIKESGNNYTSNTRAVITGDGTGAAANVEIYDGKIKRVYMTSYGSGYTYATISIVDDTRVFQTGYVDAIVNVILPPLNGHGFDAVKELYSNTMCVYTSIKNISELNILGQEYRQYGLLKDLLDIQTNRKILAESGVLTFTVGVDSTSNIPLDSILLNGLTKYRVISKTSFTVTLQQISSIYKTPQGVLTLESNPSLTWSIKSSTLNSTINKYSGDLLYAKITDPLVPSSQQSLTIRSFISV